MRPFPTISSCQPPAINADGAMAVMLSAGCEVGTSLDDALIWPCGIWCHRYELAQHSHLGGDFEVLKAGSFGWIVFCNDPSLFVGGAA